MSILAHKSLILPKEIQTILIIGRSSFINFMTRHKVNYKSATNPPDIKRRLYCLLMQHDSNCPTAREWSPGAHLFLYVAAGRAKANKKQSWASEWFSQTISLPVLLLYNLINKSLDLGKCQKLRWLCMSPISINNLRNYK